LNPDSITLPRQEHTAMPSLRWGRILLGGFLAELLLVVAIVPMRAAGASEDALTAAAVGGSFLAFVPVAWWLTRAVPRPVLHGVLMGTAAALMYTALAVVGQQFVPDSPPVPLIYYFAHLLKLAGGATGGWLARASATGAPVTTGR
jgi:hypothetical protein